MTQVNNNHFVSLSVAVYCLTSIVRSVKVEGNELLVLNSVIIYIFADCTESTTFDKFLERVSKM
jgi:hypothetical protein